MAHHKNEFTIQSGQVVTLTEGNVSSIANDTVKNESFFFKEKAEDQEIGKYSISWLWCGGFSSYGAGGLPGSKNQH